MTPEQQTATVLASIWQQELRDTHCVAASITEGRNAARRMMEALDAAGLITLPKDWVVMLTRKASPQGRNIG